MPAAVSIKEESIATLVDRFYAKVRADALLGHVFNGVIGDHWPEHLAPLTNFWTSVLLASGRYKGNPMMAHLPIRRWTRSTSVAGSSCGARPPRKSSAPRFLRRWSRSQRLGASCGARFPRE